MEDQMSIYDYPEYLPDSSNGFKPCECGYSGTMMVHGPKYYIFCPKCGRASTDGQNISKALSQDDAMNDWNKNIRMKTR